MVTKRDFFSEYNEIMYAERDVIYDFLKGQYNVVYGHQRDTWAFTSPIILKSTKGEDIPIYGIEMNKDELVIFKSNYDKKEYECSDFKYGELEKIIYALPSAESVAFDLIDQNLKRVIKENGGSFSFNDYSFYWSDYNNNSQWHFNVLSMHYSDERKRIFVKVLSKEGGQVKKIEEKDICEIPFSMLKEMNDTIMSEILHKTEEYDKIYQMVSDNELIWCFNDDDNVKFTIKGTDMEVNVKNIKINDHSKLLLECVDDCGAPLTLNESEIDSEYLPIIYNAMKFDIIDTFNAHNAELVKKINKAWKNREYHDNFAYILFALAMRDSTEIYEKFGIMIGTSDGAMDYAHEIMEGICDDEDLKLILNFVGYER